MNGIRINIIVIYCIFVCFNSSAQISSNKTSIKLGAYYFDGWSNDYHLTASLKNDYISRKPVWGWNTSTPIAIREQIDLAANAGLTFFNFCWYYPDNWHENPSQHPLNHALNEYLKSTNKNRLKFSLLVANHGGFEIGPNDWPSLIELWLSYFEDNSYLTVDGKPYITFFDLSSLVSKFGSAENVKIALNAFRNLAIKKGFKGISVAGCVSTANETTDVAARCGFDFFTGYNNQSAGFNAGKIVHPINQLTIGEKTIWDKLSRKGKPYVPVATLNWDTRPWIGFNQKELNPKRYIGFSSKSVYESVRVLKRWINTNSAYTSNEKIAVLYAWNEYGEGAWLTPSKLNKNSLLIGVKKALHSK
jgi:hypothetical protein